MREARWPIQLVQGQRGKAGVPAPSTSHPGVPKRRDASSQHRSRGQPPTNLNAWTFPMEGMEWIKWHPQQLDMPAWWQLLKEVPGQDDLQEFARRVWASFQVPKVRCHASQVDNNHSMPMAHHSLDRDWFLPLPDMWFSSQDFQLTQPQKALAYAKGLSILGRGCPTTYSWWASPVGRMHVTTLVDDGTIIYIHGWGSFRRCLTL